MHKNFEVYSLEYFLYVMNLLLTKYKNMIVSIKGVEYLFRFIFPYFSRLIYRLCGFECMRFTAICGSANVQIFNGKVMLYLTCKYNF